MPWSAEKRKAWLASDEGRAKKNATKARWKARVASDPAYKARLIEHGRKRRQRYPEKEAAIKAVKYAIDKGVLIRPESCSECGTAGEVQGHHEDYTKQLDVMWLCRACHMKRHRRVYG